MIRTTAGLSVNTGVQEHNRVILEGRKRDKMGPGELL